MRFTKYTSIENSYRAKLIGFIELAGYSRKEWIVLEKIHGSNFSMWYDGKGYKIRAAKRSGFLSPDDNFYNFQQIVKELEKNVTGLFSYLNIKPKKSVKEIAIFGEIHGGSYPHADVPTKPGVPKVQHGIWYNPDTKFIAFDMKIDGEFISFHQMEKLLEGCIPYLKPLFTGTLDECLEYSNTFQTTLPGIYGLPEITDNICEGVVIKPNEPLHFNNGDRVIVKNKNIKWSEKLQKTKTPKVEVKLSDEALELYKELTAFITENRLKNVISKFGPVNNKQFGALLGNFNRDVLEDFEKEFNVPFYALESMEQKTLRKMLGTDSSELIRSHFVEIIYGEF